jgi:hypothetical protein
MLNYKKESGESENLRNSLRDFMKRRDVTQREVSRAMGISATGFNQWLRGEYNASDKMIVEKVSAFLKKEEEKTSTPQYKRTYCETTIVKTVFEVTRKCHLKSKMGIVYGRAGLGKTTAVKKYADEDPSVILIEADLGYTPKVLFQQLSKKLGLPIAGNLHEMYNNVVDKVKGSGRLLIIDEAEHLPYRALELIRRIYDKAEIGIVLAGMPKLYFNLVGKKGEYEQLYTRILYKTCLDNLQPQDVKEIVKTALPDSGDIWEVFHAYSKGNARMLANLLENSIERAVFLGQNLDEKVIKDTSKLLYVEMFN